MLSPENSTALILALVAGLFLAGCETTAEQATVDGPPPPPEAVPFDAGADKNLQPATPPSGPAMPYNGMATLPRVNDDPQQLMGLDRATLSEKLGEPALIRRDGDAEVWQYRADRCVLDLFLYGMDKKVEHIDLRNRGDGGEDSVNDCFTGMLRAARPST
jgi:hypothetical protein